MTTVMTCPEGHNLQGTLERLTGVAEFAGHVTRDRAGTLHYEHGGYTEVDWDSETTAKNEAGETMFVCDGGDAWPSGTLVPAGGA